MKMITESYDVFLRAPTNDETSLADKPKPMTTRLPTMVQTVLECKIKTH